VNHVQDIRALLGRAHQQARPRLPEVYLCRHGNTGLNVEGRLRGLSDPFLDADGRRQAEALAVTLQPTKPSAILTSSLRRTRQTAEVVAAACGLTTEVNEDLVDRDYGPHTGHLVDEVVATWGSVDNAPGVERWESVLSRAQSALALASFRAMNGPVVLVGHDAVNSALLAFLDPTRWPEPGAVPQPTGCLNILQLDNGGWTVVIAGLVPRLVHEARPPHLSSPSVGTS
jgi:broad specificity phosphatase PhoE